MRLTPLPLSLASLALVAAPALALAAPAQEGEAAGGSSLMSPNTGLMFWTLIIFFVLFFILQRFAFPPIIEAVAAREQALERALEGAKRDREQAAALLAQQQQQLDAARADAQRMIAEGRTIGEKLRAEMLEQTRAQQQELLERAKREIEAERLRAIADLRREAVDLAIAGASKVIERNLDDQANRRLVESFLASLPAPSAPRR